MPHRGIRFAFEIAKFLQFSEKRPKKILKSYCEISRSEQGSQYHQRCAGWFSNPICDFIGRNHHFENPFQV